MELQKGGCPLGQSLFQDKKFVLDMAFTDARKKRQCKVELNMLTEALIQQEAERELKEIQVAELIAKNKRFWVSKFEKAKNLLEIKKIRANDIMSLDRVEELKLRIQFFYAEYKKIKDYTREEFEAEEQGYYTKKLALQIHEKKLNLQGTTEFALIGNNLDEDVKREIIWLESEQLKADREIKKSLKEV